MNKVIKGKRYDTETAREVACTSHGYPNEFSWWQEILYRKNTGEYFLYGSGNAASKYAETVGQNEWSGSEKIMPLTEEAARRWGEKYLDGDDYEAVFGKTEEDETKKTVTFSLPVTVIETIKSRAAADGISMSEYISRLVSADKA